MVAGVRAASLLSFRSLAVYGIASLGALLGVLVKAGLERRNFFLAAVWLTGSNTCVLVLGNFLLFVGLATGRALQSALFGALRRSETDHVVERFWYAMSDLLFILTLFPVELDVSFFAVAGTMLFVDVFHWLCEARVDAMGQMAMLPRYFHTRLIAAFSLLLVADALLMLTMGMALMNTIGPGGIRIIFAIEAIGMNVGLWSYIAKYACNCYELRQDAPWEAKSRWVFFIEFAAELIMFLTYPAVYALVLWRSSISLGGFNVSIPINVLRNMFILGRALYIRIRDLVRYRTATADMEARYPTATPEDLRALSDATCIICREELALQEEQPAATPQEQAELRGNVPKKLSCGHMFHLRCLRSWLERQQCCPTCRRSVLEHPPAGAARPAEPPAAEAAAPQQEASQAAEQRDPRPAPSAPAPEPAAPSASLESFLGRFRVERRTNERLAPRGAACSLIDAAELNPASVAAPPAKSATPQDLREEARRARLQRFEPNRAPETQTPQPVAPAFIPLFDPAQVPNFEEVCSRLEHPLAEWIRRGEPASSAAAEYTETELQDRLRILEKTREVVDASIAQVQHALRPLGHHTASEGEQ